MSLQGQQGPPLTDAVTEGHLPVMVDEVLDSLAPAPGSFQIDATVGGGGHSRPILEATTPGGRLLGLDADDAAIAQAAQNGARAGGHRRAGIGQLAGLAYDGFDHPLVAVPDIYVHHHGVEVEVAFALHIPEVDAFGARHRDR